MKWVYKIKRNAKGEVERYKARLVVKCYKQQPGIDYGEVFTVVAHLESIRLFISLASHHRWKYFHMDVKSTFLKGYLEEVYVGQPLRYAKKSHKDKVLKLKKTLYCLKQARRA